MAIWCAPSEQWRYSLPSGHSTYAALVTGSLWPLVGTRRRLALILYLVLVGWSRIAAGMHFPAEVLAGPSVSEVMRWSPPWV
nr:phosphatase PAP2 family protein [Aquitalea pelogenes]